MSTFEEVWARIIQHAGEEFHQMKGKKFTCSISGNMLTPSTTNRNLHRGQFEEASNRMPRMVKDLQDLQGPSFLYAILTDNRIKSVDTSI
jgi:hypothetical protein